MGRNRMPEGLLQVQGVLDKGGIALQKHSGNLATPHGRPLSVLAAENHGMAWFRSRNSDLVVPGANCYITEPLLAIMVPMEGGRPLPTH